MNILAREELWKRIKRREFAPVYLLFGAESYLRDLAAKHIIESVLADSALREFNESEFSLSSSPVQHALGAAEQLPMISARRIVKITDVIVSASGAKDNLKEEDEAILDAYLNRPSETSVVIFVANELDKRRKIAKLLLEKCTVVEFAEFKDDEMVSWARTKLKDLNSEADDRALRHLVGLVGNNARRLINELEKLSVAALPDKLINFDLVESFVPNSREISNFDLTDSLLAKNKTRSLQILKKILDDGAEPLMILGLIASNFRRLFQAKELMRNGIERREVAKIMRLPYSKQEDFLATARRVETEKLTWIMKRIAAADLAIKTSIGGGGTAGSRLQIEMLICELANF